MAARTIFEWTHDHSVRVAAALTVAVATPLVLLLYFQFRLVSDLGHSSALVLDRLSQQASDSIAAGIQDALRTPRDDLVLRLLPGDIEPINAPNVERTLAQVLARDPYELVDRFYIWSDYTSAPGGKLWSYDREHRRLAGGGPESSVVIERIGEAAHHKHAVNFAFPLAVGERRLYVQARIRYHDPQHQRMSSFFALAVDSEHLRRESLPKLLSQLAGRWQTPTGFPPLTVTLLDENGQVIVPPGGSPPTRYVHERDLRLVFFRAEMISDVVMFEAPIELLRLRTSYDNRTIADVIVGRQRPEYLMIGLIAALMTVGIIVVARSAASEVRLAQLKSDFVLSVSHDLKTPLALIKLFAETLELGRGKSAERRHEYYAIINSEAGRLTRLINNILDFSRGEAGLRRYKLEPGDLASLTNSVLESFETQIQQSRFDVTAECEPDLPVAAVDEGAAKQAIENLLSNAMKYSTDDRRIHVRVDRSGRYIRVQVTDHGIGIPRRLQRRIFRKFYRITNDDGTGPQGCGLGLAIVDHVMRAHRGFVRVDSELGRGSTFALHFPILCRP
jgi:signal transduction histidine kinase